MRGYKLRLIGGLEDLETVGLGFLCVEDFLETYIVEGELEEYKPTGFKEVHLSSYVAHRIWEHVVVVDVSYGNLYLPEQDFEKYYS